MSVAIKRVYETPDETDGMRILVDRLWPRGIARSRAALSEWDKQIAPTPGLRTWWAHDPSRIDEFAARYRHELDTLPAARQAVWHILDLLRRETPITLVYAAKDPHVNHAAILADYLDDLFVQTRAR